MSPGDTGKEIWEQALDTFFCGDKELIDYVQATVGMAAIGKVYQAGLQGEAESPESSPSHGPRAYGPVDVQPIAQMDDDIELQWRW